MPFRCTSAPSTRASLAPCSASPRSWGPRLAARSRHTPRGGGASTSTVSLPLSEPRSRRSGQSERVLLTCGFLLLVPIGLPVMVLVFFLLHVPGQSAPKLSLRDKLKQANLVGSFCLVPGIVCLCLVLQWGGTTYSVCLIITCDENPSLAWDADLGLRSGATDASLVCSSPPLSCWSHSLWFKSGCRTKPSCHHASSLSAALPLASGRACASVLTRPSFVRKTPAHTFPTSSAD